MEAIRILKYNLLLVLLLVSTFVYAGLQDEQTKRISKSYKVGPSVKLAVTNQFGKVHVNTWEKNEFKVDVEIIARGKDQERAQKLLDKITVKIGEGGSEKAFETVFASNMNSKGGESFEVNYMISAPSSSPVRIKNKFGDTYVASREGSSDLEISYGNLKAEDLPGPLDLHLAFGKGSVGQTGNSKIQVEYSDLLVESGDIMRMEQKFSDVEITEIGVLQLDSKYGSLEIGKAGSIKADAQYSGFSIDELSDALYLEASYVSGFEIGQLHKSFSKVEIYGKFSNYEINLEDDLKADLEAEFSFASLKDYSGDIEFYYRAKEDNRSEYKGRIGGGDSGKKIIVKSSYGDLRIE